MVDSIEALPASTARTPPRTDGPDVSTLSPAYRWATWTGWFRRKLRTRTDVRMALPPRVFFTLHETAARWGCTIADIAGWVCDGKLDILTGISAVTCGADRVSGRGII
eukprot:gene3071-4036_t